MKGSLQRIFLALDVLQNLRGIAENRIGRPTEKMNRDSQRLQVEHEESLREIKEQILRKATADGKTPEAPAFQKIPKSKGTFWKCERHPRSF